MIETPEDQFVFIDKVLKSTLIEEVWSMHAALMESFGFDRLIYGATRFRTFGDFGDVADALVLTNHDKPYMDKFFGEELYKHAPMAVWAANNTGACSWSYAEDLRRKGELNQAQLTVLRLNEMMDVLAGYSISFDQISTRSKSAIGLCARRGLTQADVDAIWDEHGDKLVRLNNLVHLKITSLPHGGQRRPLTPRQREVLEWVADGKTTQDVATIMAITSATVEKHLRLAREALNAENTAQAILKASVQNQFFLFEG